jgi:hypothetical protein
MTWLLEQLLSILLIFGGIGGALALADRVRERPQLRIQSELIHGGLAGRTVVELTIVNEGRRASSVFEAGVAVDLSTFMGLPRRRQNDMAYYASPERDRLPAKLEPWEAIRWRYELGPQEEFRGHPFVKDSTGAYHWWISRHSFAAVRLARWYLVRRWRSGAWAFRPIR